MGKWVPSEKARQVVVFDPHSSQRALVFQEREKRAEWQRTRRSARQLWLRSCGCMLVVMLVLLLLLLCLGVIVWLTLKPKPPKLSLQGITLHDLKILETSGTTIAGNKTANAAGNHTVMYMNSTLFLMATNPNRVSARYSTLYLNLTYNDFALNDHVSVPPFQLQAHGNVSVATPLSVNYMQFFRADGQNLLRDAKSNHLPLRLIGQTTAKMYVVGFKSRVQLNMDCDFVIQYQDLKVQSNVCQTTSLKL